MYFLDATYFDGNTYLPAFNRDAALGMQTFLQSVQQNNLDYFIAIYEPEYLKMLLGHKLYKDFIEGIEAETPIQKWIDLRDKIFQEIKYKDDIVFHYSPAAEYVAFKYLNRNITQTTSKGQVKSNVYEANNADLTQILPQIWNHMCDKSIELQHFICQSGQYTESVLTDREKADKRANRKVCSVIGYRDAIIKFWWNRFCFHPFRKINEFNI